jgi:hypothetical protein
MKVPSDVVAQEAIIFRGDSAAKWVVYAWVFYGFQ